MLRLAVTSVLVALLAATAATAAPARAPGIGSASRLIILKRPQRGLPAPVQAARLKIMDAAIRGHYALLEKLGMAGRRNFDFTLGDVAKPAVFWKHQEAAGNPILAKFVKTLALPYGKSKRGELYVWPAAAGQDPTDKDWTDLRKLYSERDVVLFQKYGGFTAMRLAIAADGDWIYGLEDGE